MEYVIAFLVLIGVLVWFHELGHFLMAKLLGIKVEVFSIGFGPPLLSRRYGDTEYRVSLLPLGGYVKLYGEEGKTDDPSSFSSRPAWQKILVAFAGPFFNFVLAIFLLTFIYVWGREVPSYYLQEPRVGYVLDKSLAQSMGIKEGDLLLEINGNPVKSWRDVEEVLSKTVLKRELTVKILREGQVIYLHTQRNKPEPFGAEPLLEPVVGKVLEGSPAWQVGIRPGDRLIQVEGRPITSWYDAVSAIRNSGGKPLTIRLKRKDQILDVTVVPKKDPRTGNYVIGLSPSIGTIKIRYSPSEALKHATEKVNQLTVLTLTALGKLATGELSIRTLGGPIAIAQMAGESAQQGVQTFLGLMAFISVQLAVFNLIPLPVLDGGLILLFLVEAILRRPLPDSFKEVWARLGMALIIALSIFVIFNDLLRLLGKN
ncbi:membrane-associated zinc metalloprotease [Thermocrinis albus DSM 14484]|uniref:Zinc metalloprotease n=1 Tax=Thermocrinis albus (strain DSM 14484 / JCM 11386 / HI 11/12) TaxID=638303 RepID=D3SLJ4_THEAH|nr:RIP metalloprotease RseP [Thermocrinis albus]ADC89624.1 membrane-associated zinc metalloprotease [Thermocrinis albus DSM 14484]